VIARTGLLARWRDARVETDALFGMVRPEFVFERPISERHRIAFYIGHLEAFDSNLLGERLGLASDRPELDRLFAFGIDPVEGNLPRDQPHDWPKLAEIYAYRDRVRARLDEALEETGRHEEREHQREQRLNVAIEHRQMHAETLAYLLHQLPFEQKQGAPSAAHTGMASVVADKVLIPPGPTTLGMRSSSGAFGWDNEFEATTLEVSAFEIDKFKVTNGQYLCFVDAGGYADRCLWSDDDWNWRTAGSIECPAFWRRSGDTWFWRSMFDTVPLPLAWPVYVSHAEASAYAKWAGRKLPTEAQWQRAAFPADCDSAGRPPDRQLGKISCSGSFDPLPVDSADLLSPSRFGVVRKHGNGWEWTSTPLAPFPGFRSFDSYPGYSEPFFDGKHFVLKGGSMRTASSMLRSSFRNWFQAHYPYVYAGFRCVQEGDAS
jgi:iron(II)-dependent oxidoreductase